MKNPERRRPRRRFVWQAVVAAVLIAANAHPIYSFAADYAHDREINSPDYRGGH